LYEIDAAVQQEFDSPHPTLAGRWSVAAIMRGKKPGFPVEKGHVEQGGVAMLGWLERHPGAAVALACIALFALYELSTAIFAYSGDAYVYADIVTEAPQVSGVVVKVAVSDNATVKKGDLLYEIDRTPFQLAVNLYQAQIAAAQSNMVLAETAVAEFKADVASEQAVVNDAQLRYDRMATLVRSSTVTRQALDDSARDLATAQAGLRKAIAAEAVASRTVEARLADVQEAQASLAKAEWNLQQTVVSADFDGQIAPFNLRAGDYLTAGENVLAIVTRNNLRIRANFKERFLSNIRPGKTVWFTIGNRPWVLWRGKVLSIAPGVSRNPTDPKVLPYIQPSTDWIRLPRRFPVEIDMGDAAAAELVYIGADARVLIWF
jgi:multidrug efflux system membrane fusion protein